PSPHLMSGRIDECRVTCEGLDRGERLGALPFGGLQGDHRLANLHRTIARVASDAALVFEQRPELPQSDGALTERGPTMRRLEATFGGISLRVLSDGEVNCERI